MYYAEAFGLYPDKTEGEKAAERLRSAGYEEIDLSTQEQTNEHLLPGNAHTNQRKMEKAYGGVYIGVLLGGALGFLMGMIVGLVAGVVTATVGAIVGGILGLILTDSKDKKHKDYMQQGGVRLTVRCPSGPPVERAADILRETGAAGLGVTTSTRAPMSGS